MAKPKSLSSRELIKRLAADGWILDRGRREPSHVPPPVQTGHRAGPASAQDHETRDAAGDTETGRAPPKEVGKRPAIKMRCGR